MAIPELNSSSTNPVSFPSPTRASGKVPVGSNDAKFHSLIFFSLLSFNNNLAESQEILPKPQALGEKVRRNTKFGGGVGSCRRKT